jgi:phage FluMu protein Com
MGICPEDNIGGVMLHTGKCPHCDKVLSKVRVEEIDIIDGLRPKYHGMTLVCPFCNKILHVGIDVSKYKESIAIAVADKLKA